MAPNLANELLCNQKTANKIQVVLRITLELFRCRLNNLLALHECIESG